MNSRRQFLQAAFGSAALVSLNGHVPAVLLGASRQTGQQRGERILVVIELGGGNDGLNTVIPFADDAYYQNRVPLAIPQGQVSPIDDHIGLHPSLGGFARLLDAGQLSIVQGVGYPEPNRSHFESMDLWHTAHRREESRQLGWLGRCIDDSPALRGELPAIHYGAGRQPLALGTRSRPVPSIASLDQFRLDGGNRRELAARISRNLAAPRATDNRLLGYIHESATVALQTSERLESVVGNEGAGGFPGTLLGSRLAAIARLIDADLPTRIYYATHDGFDTHSNQAEAHAGLLRELGDAMAAFMNDLSERGHAERVAVLMFSEFGRRVRENASRGTDHGTAAPVFLAGGRVQAGPFNDHPSLADLDNGDLRFSVDYRSVYATVLEDWLGVDSAPVLGKPFPTVELFRA
jgi:uncharacterized protein (DUF1501 family)